MLNHLHPLASADLPIFRSRSILAESNTLKWMKYHRLTGQLVITQLTWIWTEGDHYPLVLLSGSFQGVRFLADQRFVQPDWCLGLRSRNPSDNLSYGFLMRFLEAALNDYTASILTQIQHRPLP